MNETFIQQEIIGNLIVVGVVFWLISPILLISCYFKGN